MLDGVIAALEGKKKQASAAPDSSQQARVQ